MKLLFYFCTFFYSFLLPAQTSQLINGESTEIDERLYQVFDSDYLQTVQKDNPLLLKRWNFYLDNAFYIEEYPVEKGEPNFEKISLPDLESVNILLLEKESGIHKDWQKRMVYAISGTNKVLVYYSGLEINQKWNDFLGKKQPDYNKGVRMVNH